MENRFSFSIMKVQSVATPCVKRHYETSIKCFFMTDRRREMNVYYLRKKHQLCNNTCCKLFECNISKFLGSKVIVGEVSKQSIISSRNS
jgi:hypothetical protein